MLKTSEVTPMAKPYEKCYSTGGGKPVMIAGYALIIIGVILLFCCIPCWAWVALIGVGMMVAGVILLKISRAWR